MIRALLPLLALAAALPASAASVKVIGDLTHQADLAPGEEARGEIRVRNDGTSPQEVRIHQRDYAFHADGRNDYLEPDTLPRSNAGWVRFSPQQLVLEPGETTPVSWEMVVPEAGMERGTYWSLLMVEPVLPAPDALQGSGVRVATMFRYAVQMVTHLEGGDADLRFADRRLTEEGGLATLYLDLENTGERSLRPAVWPEVFAADGERMGRFDARRSRMYPGTSARFALALPGLAPGQYTALVVVDNGDDAIFGSQYVLEIEGTQTAAGGGRGAALP